MIITTQHFDTVSTVVELSDREKVENLLENTELSISYDIVGEHLTLAGSDALEVYSEEAAEAEFNGIGVFLNKLKEYLDGELIIQCVGGDTYPLTAYQFRVTPEAVYYSDLETDERKVEVDSGDQ